MAMLASQDFIGVRLLVTEGPSLMNHQMGGVLIGTKSVRGISQGDLYGLLTITTHPIGSLMTIR
jgi:hypothetical protein